MATAKGFQLDRWGEDSSVNDQREYRLTIGGTGTVVIPRHRGLDFFETWLTSAED